MPSRLDDRKIDSTQPSFCLSILPQPVRLLVRWGTPTPPLLLFWMRLRRPPRSFPASQTRLPGDLRTRRIVHVRFFPSPRRRREHTDNSDVSFSCVPQIVVQTPACDAGGRAATGTLRVTEEEQHLSCLHADPSSSSCCYSNDDGSSYGGGCCCDTAD